MILHYDAQFTKVSDLYAYTGARQRGSFLQAHHKVFNPYHLYQFTFEGTGCKANEVRLG
jgi:hypothetical protein